MKRNLVKLKRMWHKKIFYNSHIFEEHKVIYFSIDRTGSWSLSEAFEKSLGKESKKKYTKRNAHKYKDYFKFAIVRNPFDRVVSSYNYPLIKSNKNLSFKDFVKMISKIKDDDFRPDISNLQLSQHCYIMFDGKIVVNYIGRFENLNNEYKKICKMIGVNPVKLPYIHKKQNMNKHYSKYYNKEMIKLIKIRYKKDLELFKYKFSKKNLEMN